jgi:hypothetical protein
MAEISGRESVIAVLNKAEQTADRQPLASRWRYNVVDVERQWQILKADRDAWQAAKNLLQLDLSFPLLYGSALSFSLIMAWAYCGRPFSVLWILAPVVITVIADWSENLIHLAQSTRFEEGRVLQGDWIRIASFATTMKWSFLGVSSLLLIVFVGAVLFRSFKAFAALS